MAQRTDVDWSACDRPLRHRMVPFEVSIAILNHIADLRLVLLNNCGHVPALREARQWIAQVLAFLRGY